MVGRFSMAQWFLIAGGALLGLGLILWAALPVRTPYPPFLVTALLMLGYGGFCFWRDRAAKRPRAAKK